MKRVLFVLVSAAIVLGLSASAFADVKVKQKMTFSGQSIESTKMIKGSRERTESKVDIQGMGSDMIPNIATITQCDLRRTVKLNDKKQLYFVEPFATAETAAPTTRTTPAARTETVTRRGGTVTMTYSIRDTGERKQMFGLTARHLIITQEMESSADSCSGPSKTKMEFDGWYVDFSAEFNCPIDIPPTMPDTPSKPDCRDRFVVKGGGAAKLGFLLNGTMTMYDANGKATMTQTTETLELSRAPLPAELFDIPKGYSQADSAQALYAMPSMTDMIRDARNGRQSDTNNRPTAAARKKVSVSVNFASGVKADQSELNRLILEKVRENGYDPVTSGAADQTLTINIGKFKESTAGKIGGIFGKVTGVDTKAGSVDVEISASLSAAGGGKARQGRISRKFDGSATAAARDAIDELFDTLFDGQ